MGLWSKNLLRSKTGEVRMESLPNPNEEGYIRTVERIKDFLNDIIETYAFERPFKVSVSEIQRPQNIQMTRWEMFDRWCEVYTDEKYREHDEDEILEQIIDFFRSHMSEGSYHYLDIIPELVETNIADYRNTSDINELYKI